MVGQRKRGSMIVLDAAEGAAAPGLCREPTPDLVCRRRQGKMIILASTSPKCGPVSPA